MTRVGVLEAKTRFSALVDEVEQGGEVIVTKRGRPAIKLVKADEEPRLRETAGEELVRMMKELHALQKANTPDEHPETWEQLKEQIRR